MSEPEMHTDWERVEYVPKEGDDPTLPHVTHEGTMRFADLAITVYQLSDGQRVIPPESLAAFLLWLGADPNEIVVADG